MDQLLIDISDIIEELGILFANLIEDYPLNELLQSDLNNITYEQQDPILSSTENCLHLPEAVYDVPGDAQHREYRKTICTPAESLTIWMGSNTYSDNGWRPGTVGNQYYARGGLQITSSRSIHGQCGCHLCTGGLTSFKEFRRLEQATGTLLTHPNIDYRSGWLLRSKPVQRSTSFRFKRHHVACGVASNKGPPAWG